MNLILGILSNSSKPYLILIYRILDKNIRQNILPITLSALLYPRQWRTENGEMEFSQPECESGISVPGSFKLDHLPPVKPMLFPKFSNFFTFILGRLE